jgi:glycosyltransferase involved in cell wall biosynthesis
MDAVPEKCLSIIDTHDVMCFREYRFYQHGLHHTISMSLSLQEEKSVLERFDAILAIQDEEHSVLRQILPQKPIILCPHSILSQNNHQVTSSIIKHIGFIGANNEANRSGLEWFITQVWPVVKQLDLTLYIFGGVGQHFQHLYKTDATIKYISNDLSQEEIYSLVDCMINPVFVGGGLKIKSLEALAYGKPLISTEEGAVGIGNNQESGVMIARNRTEFIDAFIYLVNKHSLRKELISQGISLVQKNFSPEACYRPLMNLLQHA